MSEHQPKSRHPPFPEVEAARPDFDASFTPVMTKTPNPNFKPGDGLNDLPYAKDFAADTGSFKTIDLDNESPRDVYKLLISSVTPRPIAFVSTLSSDGKGNLAPMSYFNLVGNNPAALMISVTAGTASQHPDGLKDTNHNIKTTKEFCVSIISEPFIEAANYTSIDAPYGVDEWKLSGLTPRPSESVKPPHVAESAVSMECEVIHWYDLLGTDGKATHSVIIGLIKRFHVKEFVLDPEDPMKVLTEKLRPIGRLGGIAYTRSTQMIEIPRPVWEQVKDTPEVKAALAQDSATK